MILIAHYFPGIDINELDDEGFAMWSENAYWLREQDHKMMVAGMSAMFGGTGNGK